MGGASPEHQGSPWVCANCGAGATTQHFSTACFVSTSQFLLELLFLAALDDGQSPVPRPELFPLQVAFGHSFITATESKSG